jgi:hypothetical protein
LVALKFCRTSASDNCLKCIIVLAIFPEYCPIPTLDSSYVPIDKYLPDVFVGVTFCSIEVFPKLPLVVTVADCLTPFMYKTISLVDEL